MFNIREPYTPSLMNRACGSIVQVGSIEGALKQPTLLAEQTLGLGAIGALGGGLIGLMIGYPGAGAAVGGIVGAAIGFGDVVAKW